jgi:hypothetical protein
MALWEACSVVWADALGGADVSRPSGSSSSGGRGFDDPLAHLPGPRSAQFNQHLGNQLLQLISSLFTNPVNQINRIGGQEVPLYDPSLTWRDVFRNAGYGDTAANIMSLPAALAEPGPTELRLLGDLAPILASVLPWGRAARGNPSAEAVLQFADRVMRPEQRTFDFFWTDMQQLAGTPPSRIVLTRGPDTRATLKFGDDTTMAVAHGRLPDGREALYVDSLLTENPHALGGGLRLSNEQRQLLSLLDLADTYRVPIYTNPGAFGHMNMTTAELAHMYNRLGFQGKLNDSPFVREPMPTEWAARRAELAARYDDELSALAEKSRAFRQMHFEGRPPPYGEAPNRGALLMFEELASKAGVDPYVLGQEIGSSFVGKSFPEAHELAQRLSRKYGIDVNDAISMIFFYADMFDF